MDVDREPESPKCRLDDETTSAKTQRSVVMRGELLVFRRHIPVERDDVPVKTNAGAGQQEKAALLYQCGIHTHEQVERGKVLPGVDDGYANGIHLPGVYRHGA